MHIETVKCAFKNRVFCGKIVNVKNIINPSAFLSACKMLLVLKIGEFFMSYRSAIKLNFEMACEYVVKKGQTESLFTIYFSTRMLPLTFSENFNEWFEENIQQPILTKMDEFQERDSGKALNRIIHLQVSCLFLNLCLD